MLYRTQARWFSGQTEVLPKEASLGIVWANAVNTRVMLSRTGRRRLLDQVDLTESARKRSRREGNAEADVDLAEDGPPRASVLADNTKPTLVRRLHVVFSPFAPPGTVDFVITPSGIHSLPGSYRVIKDAVPAPREQKAAQGEGGLDEGSAVHRSGMLGGERRPGPFGAESDESDEFGGEVFDDFGDLPDEFWEGKVAGVSSEALAQGEGVSER